MASNYTYKYIIDEYGQIVYPRTVLSAVDIITANGLQVEGDRLFVVYATKAQIHQGATGSILSADGLKEAIATYNDTLYIAGGGIKIQGGTIGADPAEINAILARTGDLTKSVTNGNLNGALNLGRAVDVTSDRNSNSFTVTTYTEIIDGITDDCIRLVKTSAAVSTAYYYGWAPLPKFVSGLKYLLMCDVKNVGIAGTALMGYHNGRVAIQGIPFDMTVEPNQGSWTRLASLQTAAGNSGFWFVPSAAGNADVRLKHLKVFEVTALSDEAIYALATAEHPEQVYEKYLVQNDAVCPWIKTINMNNSASVTIQSGLSYRLNANDGAIHTLMIDTFPADAHGRDAHLTLYLDGTSSVLATLPLVIVDPLVPNAANNCVIKFRDGYARLYVTDTDYGYIVVTNTGTDDGSLYYGLYKTTEDYIQFAHSTDEVECVAVSGSSAVPQTTSPTRTLMGNGVDKTIADFNNNQLKPAKALTVTNATIKNANITGGTVYVDGGGLSGTVNQTAGTLKFGNIVEINGTLNYSGGTLLVTGSTIRNGVVELNGTKNLGTVSLVVSNVWFKNGYCATYGGVFTASNTRIDLTGCTFTNCRAVGNNGGGFAFRPGTGNVTNVLVDNCTAGRYGGGFECSYNRDTTNVITASTISNCLGYYGAFCTWNNKTKMVDSYIVGNSSSEGTIYINAAPVDVDIINTEIKNNTVSTNGGGIEVLSGNLTITNCRLFNNKANNGGGIYSANAQVTMTGSTISDCIATGYGSALIQYTTTMTISNSLITNNKNTTYGNIYVASGSLTINGSTISDNYTKIMHFEQRGGSVSLNNCLITGNTSQADVGPAFYNTGSGITMTITGCTITNNLCMSTTMAGTLYNSGGAIMVVEDTVIQGNISSAGFGEVSGINGGTQSYSNCVLDGGIWVKNENVSKIEFKNYNKFIGSVTGTPGNLTIITTSGATINLQGNQNENPLQAGTITAQGKLTITDKNGNRHDYQARSITGSTITNMGQWLPYPGRLKFTAANETWEMRDIVWLNNYTATSSAKEKAIVVTGTSTNVTLNNVMVYNNINGVDTALTGFLAYAGANTSLTINGGTFTNCQSCGEMAITASDANSHMNINNTVITEIVMTSSGRGAIGAFGGATVSLTGTTISKIRGRVDVSLFARSSGVITATNCLITGCTSTGGDGVGVTSYIQSNVTLTGCTITQNYISTAWAGGAGSNSNSTMTLNNCSVLGNTAGVGGGLDVRNNASMTVSNSTIKNNVALASDAGSLVAINDTSVINFTGGNDMTGSIYAVGTAPKMNLSGNNKLSSGFTNGSALDVLTITISDGATINLSSNTTANVLKARNIIAQGSFTVIDKDGVSHTHTARQVLTGSTITNTGLWLPTSATVTSRQVLSTNGSNTSYSNILIQNSTVSVAGSAISVSNGATVSVSGSTITGNTAGAGTMNTGALAVVGTSSKLTVTNTLITNNIADGSSAGILTYQGTLIVTGCTISGNTSGTPSTSYGGAIRAAQSGILTFTNCLITKNYAKASGGAMVVVDSATITLTGCTVTGNSCGNGNYSGCDVERGNSTLIIDGGIYNDSIYIYSGSAKLTLKGNITLTSFINNAGTTVTIATGATINLKGNSNTNVIYGGTIVAQGNFVVIDRNGTSHSYTATTKTNSVIKNDGTWT